MVLQAGHIVDFQVKLLTHKVVNGEFQAANGDN
jgi:hypothetical protein